MLALGMAVSMIVPAASAKAPGPNGRIVFEADDPGSDETHIFTVDPDGSDLRELPVGGFCFRWSPDGRKLATTADSPYGARPAVMNPDGSGFTVLDATTANINLACPSWSPDGTRIALEGFNDDDPSVVHGSTPSEPQTVETSPSWPTKGSARATTRPTALRSHFRREWTKWPSSRRTERASGLSRRRTSTGTAD
jgi:Tol biopolymer transport system component